MRRMAGLAIVIAFMTVALFAFGDSVVFPNARSTMTFGFLLLAAYLFGDVLSRFKLPKITGYILSGILFGPFVFGFITVDIISELKLLDDLALTFIALAAGGELRMKELRERRKSIFLTVLFLTGLVFIGMAGFAVASKSMIPFLEGKSMVHVLAVAALLGTLAVARSPSSAIAIISECKSRGPFTEMVLGVTVVMDMLVIILFAVVVSVFQALITPGSRFDINFILVASMGIMASIFVGVILGRIISLYIKYIKAELLIFILGLAFMVSFMSRQFALFLDHVYDINFHFEPMLICMTAGFVVQNYSRHGALFLEKIDRSSLPVYVLFFSLTGAALDMNALGRIWFYAVMLVIVRSLFIYAGSYLGSRLSSDPPRFRRMSGLSFITQAGVSLGLASIIVRCFPDWGTALSTIIVATITINQIIGPVTFKYALNKVGETRKAGRKSALK